MSKARLAPWLVWLALQARGADAIPFTRIVADSSNSGDNKAIADIDLDGRSDPILGGDSLVWYEAGNRLAKHVIRAEPINGEYSTDMQAQDVDGDGDPDIITGDHNRSPNIFWYENPTLDPPTGKSPDPRIGENWIHHAIGYHGEWAHDIEVGDLNRDGRLDVVTSGHGKARVWIQNEPSSWAMTDISSLAGKGIYIADIDADGFPDIAVHDGWLENSGGPAPSWSRHKIEGMAGDEVAAADFNRDGRIDLAVFDAHAAREFAWYEAPEEPAGPLWTKRVVSKAMGSHKGEVADFNADGWPDLLMGLERSDLSIYLNRGDGKFDKQQLDSAAAHNARCGDLDGDGDIDVFGCDYIGYPPAVVYLNDGWWGSFKRGDANADGSVDISDAISTLLYLFGEAAPIPCLPSADANDDEAIGLADPLRILGYLFANGQALPPPFGRCAIDSDTGDLACEAFPPCM